MGNSDVLVKISEYEWIKSFVEKGEVYMSPLRTFQKLEYAGIGDPEEGLFSKINDAEIVLNEKCFEGRCDVRIWSGLNYPVYCCSILNMTSERNGGAFARISEKMISEFIRGKEKPALIVFSKSRFVARMKEKCGDALRYGDVQYTDTWINRGVFNKNKEFEYQNEFRLLLKEYHEKPVIVKITPFISHKQIISLGGYQSGDLIFEFEEYL